MINIQPFGTMPDGQPVTVYQLTNGNGMRIDCLSLGAIIQRWILPDERDIVLGFDSVEAYLADNAYMGTVVGRYANRIAKGQLTVGAQHFQLPQNLGAHCLHGGTDGFHHRLWQVHIIDDSDQPSIQFSLTSPDGDQGFPGTLQASVTYHLDNDNRLSITYRGQCDKDTVFNPTQHSYFNLAGHDSGSVLDTRLQVMADHYTPADADNIPLGDLRDVTGTPFDLRQPQGLHDKVHSTHAEIRAAGGLDHNWCVNGALLSERAVRHAATAWHDASQTALRVETDMPGLQVYTGNFIGAEPLGKSRCHYQPFHGFCLETQYFPDSPNNNNFPSALLKAGKSFCSQTVYQILFSGND